METLLITALAVVLDIALGDPPNIIHPVAWMGKIISLLEKGGRKLKPAGQFIYGVLITLFTTALFAVPAFYLVHYLRDTNKVAYVIVTAVILKLMFSIRGLGAAAFRIKRLLTEDNLPQTRHDIRALVSRNAADLNTTQLSSAAVESVAEGTCDSMVAPLFFFLLLGLPGVVGYRVVNTFDSMIGYHGKYEYLGKFAARFDDVLNYIPARLAALVLVCAAVLTKSARRAWRTAWREHRKTESPNAGWPMATMAGALGVRLEKVDYYVLGNDFAAPGIETIDRAVKTFCGAATIWVLLCLATGAIELAITA
jgi:adenosylcobinamide-phosphate synthase